MAPAAIAEWARCDRFVGGHCASAGRTADALRLARRSIRLLLPLDNYLTGYAHSQLMLGRIHADLDDWNAALVGLEAALFALSDGQPKAVMGSAFRSLGRAYLRLSDGPAGMRMLEEAKRCFRDLSDARAEEVAAYVQDLRRNYPTAVFENQAESEMESPRKRVDSDVDIDASRGDSDGFVELVVFVDFSSLESQRFKSVLMQLLVKYPEHLKVVFKHRPLKDDARATRAAFAAMAAQAQDFFGPMHDLLSTRDGGLEDADIRRHADALGLDLVRFETDMADQAGVFARRLLRDRESAYNARLWSTPACVINGRRLMLGPASFEWLSQVIDEESQRATALGAVSGLTGHALRDELMRDEFSHLFEPKLQSITISEHNPVLGDTAASCVLTVFADLTSPFALTDLRRLRDLHVNGSDDVCLVFKHHAGPSLWPSEPPARLAIHFHRQGKFWDFLDASMSISHWRTPDGLVELAAKLGLDRAGVEACLAGGPPEVLTADIAEAQRLGVSSPTVTVFVNGRRYRGSTLDLEQALSGLPA